NYVLAWASDSLFEAHEQEVLRSFEQREEGKDPLLSALKLAAIRLRVDPSSSRKRGHFLKTFLDLLAKAESLGEEEAREQLQEDPSSLVISHAIQQSIEAGLANEIAQILMVKSRIQQLDRIGSVERVLFPLLEKAAFPEANALLGTYLEI